MASIDVEPLQHDLRFGARISGLTQHTVQSANVQQQIRDVFEDRGVIVFEAVEPTAEMQVLISEVIGPLKDHPVKMVQRYDRDNLPGVITIATSPKSAIVEIDGEPLITWQPWHFDHTYNDELNRAGVLRAEKIAPEGGATAFADGIDIYDQMAPEIREKAEALNLIYTLDMRYEQQTWGLPEKFRILQSGDDAIMEVAKTFPRAIHPAVWTRSSGENVLHMTPYGCQGVEGMDTAEGEALCQEIWDEVQRCIQPYVHHWQPGDMLLWDNWRVLHEACGCNPKYDRIMHRTTIKGDYGLGRWEIPAASAG